uniref:B30.2/SPRY domain-containing protein n=1 Tax=Parastrongyloides trichosuri TaxID=131310 RepID=A0A0N4ZPB7_PARTI
MESIGENVNNETSTAVCYCNGTRELGTLEIHCVGCRKWFHTKCFKDLKEFYGLPFMVSYTFHCKDCSSTKKETWTGKTVTFIHMCVMAMANITYNKRCETGNYGERYFFDVDTVIIPYFTRNWENLSGEKKRIKNTWHQTLKRTLSKESGLFLYKEPNNYALVECDLHKIGPLMEGLRNPGRKPGSSSKENVENKDTDSIVVRQTRGSRKRAADDKKSVSKKSKTCNDNVFDKNGSEDSTIDYPLNKEGHRYHLAVKDIAFPDHEMYTNTLVTNTSIRIPTFVYRLADIPKVSLSPSDRAPQLILSNDNLTVANVEFEGYCMAKATHSVSKGKWYYEVLFDSQPQGTHIRIGWSTKDAVVQAPVGYTEFSYSWRSHHGTVFHKAKGRTYGKKDFKEGDVLGCAIYFDDDNVEQITSDLLPFTAKSCYTVVNHKSNVFFIDFTDPSSLKKDRPIAKGSRIEFFHNGESCGTAFQDIYQDFYFPAVSIFENARVTCNFGPNFIHPPPEGVKGMNERVFENDIETCLSDMLYFVENNDTIEETRKMFMEHKL